MLRGRSALLLALAVSGLWVNSAPAEAHGPALTLDGVETVAPTEPASPAGREARALLQTLDPRSEGLLVREALHTLARARGALAAGDTKHATQLEDLALQQALTAKAEGEARRAEAELQTLRKEEEALRAREASLLAEQGELDAKQRQASESLRRAEAEAEERLAVRTEAAARPTSGSRPPGKGKGTKTSPNRPPKAKGLESGRQGVEP